MTRAKRNEYKSLYVLLPVGSQNSLGLVVTSQPVDSALDENQAEFGVFVLKTHVR